MATIRVDDKSFEVLGQIPPESGKVLGWPRCAVCNKPVERLYLADDPRNLAMLIILRCHGKSERIQVTAQQFGMLTEPNWMQKFMAGEVMRLDGDAFTKTAEQVAIEPPAMMIEEPKK